MSRVVQARMLGSFETLVAAECRRTQPARLLLGRRYSNMPKDEFRKLLMFDLVEDAFDEDLRDDVCRIWWHALSENGIDLDFSKTPDNLISIIGREIGIDRMVAARIKGVPLDDIAV